MWKLFQFSHNCTGQGGGHVKDPRHPEGEEYQPGHNVQDKWIKKHMYPQKCTHRLIKGLFAWGLIVGSQLIHNMDVAQYI